MERVIIKGIQKTREEGRGGEWVEVISCCDIAIEKS
jgi:hypothetical protein